MSAETATVTDAQRIDYTVKRLGRWADNYDTNAAQRMIDGQHREAHRLTIQASTMRDIIKMLDGTEDSHIGALLRSAQ